MNNKEISWDLSEIFQGSDDPRIDVVIKELEEKTKQLAQNYKGKISSSEFSSDDLLKLLQEQEEFQAKLFELSNFARLTFAANMTIPENRELNNRVEEFNARIRKELAFLELEVGKLVYDKKDLIHDSKLANYKHFLEKLRRSHPHKLSEIEEQLIIEKDQYGIRGWQQLQSKWLNTRKFEVEVEGEKKTLSYGETTGLRSHKDRGTRISAIKSVFGSLREDHEIYSSAMHNICSDWVMVSKRRKHDSPMHQSLIANDVDQNVIDNLMKTIEEHAELYQRYLKLKANLLNVPKLGCEDLSAPLLDAPDIEYNWETAKVLIIEAFSNFDEDFVSVAKDMFDRNHIDASPRFGKRNGAFCSTWYNGKTSYILQSFNNTLGNVYTLAHELGHAVHGYMTTREQTFSNARNPMVVAEVASIFCELLLTDFLLAKAESNEEKKAILTKVLDGAGMVIFQVSIRVWLEQNMYKEIEAGKYLDGETITKLWTTARSRIFNDTVEWLEDLDWIWIITPHYFLPNFRYYNYPYVFAQLFVYSLYQKYLDEGEAFIPKLKQLLKAGGSKSPKEFGEMMGVDISGPDFWKLGMQQYERLLNELEKII